MFVDTPGLVDGDMLYPFDVNQSIEFLGTYLIAFFTALFLFSAREQLTFKTHIVQFLLSPGLGWFCVFKGYTTQANFIIT